MRMIIVALVIAVIAIILAIEFKLSGPTILAITVGLMVGLIAVTPRSKGGLGIFEKKKENQTKG